MSKIRKNLSFLQKLFLSLTVLTLFSGSVFAQNRTITGVVKDAQGETIIAASVVVKGTTIGTVTDIDGVFRLEVPASAKTLVVSYVGMQTQEVAITGTSLNVVLKDDAKMLDEVVAIGYGTVRRKDITGSVASVNADAIAAIPVNSASEAIAGKLAGVQVTTTEGSPDAEVKIRVRGGGSITGENKPLYVVDGFPVSSISDIAPGDIETIDVLKDASSTAIYGSRGANGVIIVTTKSGKAGKISVNYNAFTSWKKMAKTLPVLSGSDYAKWQYELALLNDDVESYEKFFGNYEDIDLYDNVPTNDWQNLVFGRTGFTFNHNLSINGGTDKSKFAFSYSNVNDRAIMEMSSFRRDNLNFKMNTKATDNVTLDFSARYSNTAIYGGGANEQREVSSADSRLKHAMIYTPFPLSDLDSESGSSDDTEVGNLYNPLENISDNDRQQKRRTFNLAGAVTWEVVKNLKLKAEVGFDDYINKDNRYYGMTTYYIKNVPSSTNQNHPAVILTNTDRNVIRSTNTLNYDFKKLLNPDHGLNFLLGHEYIYLQQNILGTTVHGFPTSFSSDEAFRLTTQGYAYSIDNYFSPDDKLLSFFSRANYDYKSKYLLSATFRADGSSKFSKGNKWGYFPSAAAAWRVSGEDFMADSKHWLDDLKLRLSYGTAGNNDIPAGQMTQSFESKSTSWINGYSSYWAASKTMANPDLKWETTITRNVGIDFTLFNSRLNGTLEGYWNSTKDLLIDFPITGTGYDSQYRNMGETRNRGIEASLNWIAIDKKNFGFSVSGNIGFNNNKIISLGLINEITSTATYSNWASTEIGQDFRVVTGGSVGEMFGYVSDGRYEVDDFTGYNATTQKWELKEGVVDASGVIGTLRPGSMKLKNLTEGDNAITVDDRKVIGNANPIHTGGITLNGRVYSFDLSAVFNWSVGNDIYNANKVEYTSTSKYQYRNMTTEMESGNRWTNLNADGTLSNDPAELTALNANTTMWSPYMARYVFSDWAVEDGSFLRLNTLTLGYTLPKSLLNSMKISNLRVYATGYNVFVLTNYSGFDPEVSTRRRTALTPGVDYSAYPKSRQIVLGLNLSF
ncbi:MAG: TonB-dependent receptor [Paludibacteraceae bacterium]|nr:TonB-dependent receptor [Paludibacteraceae bacterium]